MIVVDHLKLYLEIKLNYNYIGVKVHSWTGFKPLPSPQIHTIFPGQLSSPFIDGSSKRIMTSQKNTYHKESNKFTSTPSGDPILPSSLPSNAIPSLPFPPSLSSALNNSNSFSISKTTTSSTTTNNNTGNNNLFLLSGEDIELEFQLNKNNQCLRKWIQSSKELQEGITPEVWIVEYDQIGNIISKWRLVNPIIKNYQENVIPSRNHLLKCNIILSCSGYSAVPSF